MIKIQLLTLIITSFLSYSLKAEEKSLYKGNLKCLALSQFKNKMASSEQLFETSFSLEKGVSNEKEISLTREYYNEKDIHKNKLVTDTYTIKIKASVHDYFSDEATPRYSFKARYNLDFSRRKAPWKVSNTIHISGDWGHVGDGVQGKEYGVNPYNKYNEYIESNEIFQEAIKIEDLNLVMNCYVSIRPTHKK